MLRYDMLRDSTLRYDMRRNDMLRSVYLATLSILQLALVIKLAPPLGEALRADALAELAPAGWAAMLQLFATGLAVAGAALALVFPGVALSRHRRAGAMRFLGLPRWAVVIALGGIAVLGTAVLGLALLPAFPVEIRAAVLLVVRPAITGGLALTTAGVLCAELLRRSVASREVSAGMHPAPGRIEVTYPPDLRTRAVPSNVPAIQGRPA
jgi:hypothetical protein